MYGVCFLCLYTCLLCMCVCVCELQRSDISIRSRMSWIEPVCVAGGEGASGFSLNGPTDRKSIAWRRRSPQQPQPYLTSPHINLRVHITQNPRWHVPAILGERLECFSVVCQLMNVTCRDGFILYAGTNTVTDKLRSIVQLWVSSVSTDRSHGTNLKSLFLMGKQWKDQSIIIKKKAINKTMGSAMSTRFWLAGGCVLCSDKIMTLAQWIHTCSQFILSIAGGLLVLAFRRMLLVACSCNWHRKCHCEVWRFSNNMNEQTVKVTLKSVLYLWFFWGMNVQLAPKKFLPPLERWLYFVSGIVIHVLMVWLGLGTKTTWSRHKHSWKIVLKSFISPNMWFCCHKHDKWRKSHIVKSLKLFEISKCPNVVPSSDMRVSSSCDCDSTCMLENIIYITLVLSTFYSVGWA